MKKPINRKRAPGGGRKPIPEGERRVTRTYSLAPATATHIEREAQRLGVSAGRALDALVSRRNYFQTNSLTT